MKKRGLVFLVLLVIMAAWIAGAFRTRTARDPFIRQAMPDAEIFLSIGNRIFEARTGSRRTGLVRIQSADGYGGPLTLAVSIDSLGTIRGAAVIDHKESSAYFRKVMSRNLPGQLKGRSVTDSLRLGVDIQGVTGATRTSRAIVTAVRIGSRAAARKYPGLDVPAERRASIRFGWPETVLISLFILGFTAGSIKGRTGRALRGISLLAGLIFIGFIYTIPLTLSHFTGLMMGYLPRWQDHLYVYILIVGMLMPLLITGRNVYCASVCPFGAVQEGLAFMGGASGKIRPKTRNRLRGLHDLLVLTAIAAALVLRHPGATSYEVYGSLFDFTGSVVQFAVLGAVLILSLFFFRPWCRFLCPVRALERYMRRLRSKERQKGVE
ncbi:MAG TPA: 4Fe-4S binding protein [bacterium]|nr:4Fe-4S binding protein [bacterium]